MCSIESIESDLRCTVEEIASVAFEPKLKFMRPFDTVLVCQLNVCHISGFYLDRRFAFWVNSHTLTQVGVINCVCVCVCGSGHCLSCKPVFVFSFFIFFWFFSAVAFFELPIRAKTHKYVSVCVCVCVNCNCKMNTGQVLRSRCSSRLFIFTFFQCRSYW